MGYSRNYVEFFPKTIVAKVLLVEAIFLEDHVTNPLYSKRPKSGLLLYLFFLFQGDGKISKPFLCNGFGQLHLQSNNKFVAIYLSNFNLDVFLKEKRVLKTSVPIRYIHNLRIPNLDMWWLKKGKLKQNMI